ncbi:PDGLE domain-containing protein [Rhodococcus sp. CH91]|uniref:PDGLE domain-containing protein n=1 Tax=Rhodococcus sp. CH91 TaxID=2910256 RepID=UPI001F4BA58C|nr:PDGLE domain-containing protein [Rhodococcus sp. CH91]
MRTSRILVVLGIAVLLIAGLMSYLADPDPDGLEAATTRGCEVVQNEGEDVIAGDCPAAVAEDHAFATSPLADYSVGDRDGSTGIAGVVGALMTLAVAIGMFRLLARRRRAPTRDPAPEEGGP